ncbi:uncharacterized protein LOC116857713 isoform X1 [Lontra canadensis]|uniref:uncharacterized protein LOC116857713 isoform X1 n=1 Tax=Lontra canadensis TaxID=76717 RepID=UPI0013F2B4E0|nr:uncharacterized protein LOC116857713 isoform X1 [Lontra canadensis]
MAWLERRPEVLTARRCNRKRKMRGLPGRFSGSAQALWVQCRDGRALYGSYCGQRAGLRNSGDKDAGLGPEKAWAVGRVPMWPLWTILLLVRPLGGLGSPLCPREPFYFLVAIMKMLGNKNDGTLYTPDDLSVCPAETLGCFRLELSVIQFEEGPSLGIAVFRLQRLLDALGSRLWVTGQGPCPPCEGHPQRPVPLFLAKLLELLQGACARHRPLA